MKSKLSPELTKEICDNIRKGLYLKDACALADISHQTFYNWVDRAEMGEPLYVDFLEAVKKAEAEDKAARLADAKVKAADRKSWEENWRYLEARYPEQYAKHEVVHNTNEGEGLRVIKRLLELKNKPETLPENGVIEGEVKVLE